MVTDIKYLGLILDQNLIFNWHIDSKKKATQKLGALGKVWKCVHPSTALTPNKSWVLLHSEYCDSAYIQTSQLNLNTLQIIQNSACRTLLLASRDCQTSDMHRDLNLMYLNTRRLIHVQSLNHRNIYFEENATL